MKRSRFLFLGVFLLLEPVTPCYAMSWENLRKKYAQSINTDAARKIMPVGVLALGFAAGGLYYYYHSLKKKAETSMRSLVTLNYVWPALEQLDVYSQFNSDGGGSASCGYQTLLRAMQVVKSKSGGEDEKALKKALRDPVSISLYFGPEGKWRKEIIARRKDQELKKLLHAKLLLALTQGGDAKAKDLYKSSLGFLEDILVALSRDPEKRSKPYDLTDEAIKGYLIKSLDQLKNETNEDLIEELKSSETIDKYFDLDKMRKEVLSENFISNLPALIQQLNDDPNLQGDFAGEWLSDGEVEYLWEHNRSDIVPKGVECGFKAIANFNLVGNPDIPQEFDEVALYIKDNVKPFLNKEQQFFTIFALGTMRQGSDTKGTRGHWYPLVMYQNNEGKREYYIMDSAGNRNRRNDMNAWKIINLIEQ